MKFETTFAHGDLLWAFDGDKVVQRTVGKIRIKSTNSQGDAGAVFDSEKPQREYVEEYMCEESGINSGSIYRLGKTAFATREECEKAFAKVISAKKAVAQEQARLKREMLIADKEHHLRQLALIAVAEQQAGA